MFFETNPLELSYTTKFTFTDKLENDNVEFKTLLYFNSFR